MRSYRFWSGWRRCLAMVQPDTVIRWHRRAFAWHWTRKSRRLPGRPEVAANIRDLIRRMSQANPLWGAPRIHGELLKLGIAVAQSTVARYLPRPRKPPSQGRKTLWSSHSRIENKGLGVAAGLLLGCTAFMRFRGPQALKDRLGEPSKELPITLSNNSRVWDCRSFPVLPRPPAGPPASDESSGRPRPSIFSPCRPRPSGSCSSSWCSRMSDAGCCTSG